MSGSHTLAEFRSAWLPHVSDDGLTRLVELLDRGSPLLIHGAFSKACAMGCLATHIAWHHPLTRDLSDEAGVCWLTRVAKLNPATSHVILAWDRAGSADWALRAELLRECRAEIARRDHTPWNDEPSHGYDGTDGVPRTTSPSACDAR
jgi:hypothetical protein